VDVYLVDGTYELFRHFFALPSHITKRGEEVAAARGVLASMLGMLADGSTHLAVASDHIIESFRNELWPGYKTGAGIDPRLLNQFPLLEEGLAALGIPTFPMVEFEADDALASAAARVTAASEVQRVYVCSPDKDLAQCVRGDRVVQLDRRSGKVVDEPAVIAKFGVGPGSIPDFLALVGDAADGYPGLPGWGRTSAAAVLKRYRQIDLISNDASSWDVAVRGASRLAPTLREQRAQAYLFLDLATLRTEARLFGSVEELRWTGPASTFQTRRPPTLRRRRVGRDHRPAPRRPASGRSLGHDGGQHLGRGRDRLLQLPR